jgi:hypothetical protein
VATKYLAHILSTQRVLHYLNDGFNLEISLKVILILHGGDVQRLVGEKYS